MGGNEPIVKVINRETIWSRIQALEYIEGLAMARKAQSFTRTVNIIPGPLGMFRKSVLMEVGGYDHHTFAEDCDLTLKLLMRGWHVIYESKAIAWVETPSRRPASRIALRSVVSRSSCPRCTPYAWCLTASRQ